MKITNTKYWYKIKSLVPHHVFEMMLHFYYGIQSIRYSGNNFYCPVCNKTFSEFSTTNCPRCGADNRHRILWLFLKKKTDFFTKNLKVLHFAPEFCFYKRMSNLNNLDYISADINSPRAKIKIDISNMDLPEESFDVVLSSHVLEHIDNDIQAMKELFRIQKKGSWSIHMVPLDGERNITFENNSIKTPEERMKHYGHYDHKRIYGNDFKNRLESVGFEVQRYCVNDFCDETETVSMGLIKGDDIFLCKKY